MVLPEHTSINRPVYFYRPRKDERLSWPSWLTCSGRFTHMWSPVGCRPSEDRVSSPAKDQRSAVLRNQPTYETYSDIVLTERVSVRLVGGDRHRGRLEVRHNGVWGTVCGNYFNNAAATVVCNMLGFGYVLTS